MQAPHQTVTLFYPIRMDSSDTGIPLPNSFFDREPDKVAPDLLGMVVVSLADGVLTSGAIVETEAYFGPEDPGSHAATRRVTDRNAVMYGRPGTVYIYFTYGNHHMLNFVCRPEGKAGAVLVRALEPLEGIDVMRRRRGDKPLLELANGPGKLTQALGLDLSANGTQLGTGPLTVYAGGRSDGSDISVGGRVGLSRGHELDLRYRITGNKYVSRGRPGPRRTNRKKEPL